MPLLLLLKLLVSGLAAEREQGDLNSGYREEKFARVKYSLLGLTITGRGELTIGGVYRDGVAALNLMDNNNSLSRYAILRIMTA